MATIDDLVKIRNVVIAFEFAPDGTLAKYEANVEAPPELAAMAAQFCASITMNFNTLASAFTKLNAMPWVPQQGWTYSGGEYTAVMGDGGYKGVFAETAKADFNQLFNILVGNP
jgi:roadblock/LC7 domain-containing protein